MSNESSKGVCIETRDNTGLFKERCRNANFNSQNTNISGCWVTLGQPNFRYRWSKGWPGKVLKNTFKCNWCNSRVECGGCLIRGSANNEGRNLYWQDASMGMHYVVIKGHVIVISDPTVYSMVQINWYLGVPTVVYGADTQGQVLVTNILMVQINWCLLGVPTVVQGADTQGQVLTV